MKLQKIMLDAGFTCPNRDGRVGHGGCTFCRTESFNPDYCKGSITEQLERGKRFFEGKYPEMKYLAYFQAYTNTYAPLGILKQRYEEALAVKDVAGLVIATRPDCIDKERLEYLRTIRERGFLVTIELGVESLYDKTLQRVNRGHTAAQSEEAIRLCAEQGFFPTVHLMVGLPGETRDDILSEAEKLNALPIGNLKLHQLQILKGTEMAEEWKLHPEDFLNPSLEQYVELISAFINKLRPGIRIERYVAEAPSALLLSPKWGVKPSTVLLLVEQKSNKNRTKTR